MKSGKKAGRGYAEGSLKALEPTKFKKGETIPGPGRPKGSLSLKDKMKQFLDLDVKIKMPDGTIQDKSVLESIILSLLSQAQKGNIRAIQEVLDRNFGKEPDVIEISHEDRLKELK
jgi:hypothetical protein